MEKSYNNRLKLTLFIFVLIPFIIASFVFMGFRIREIYKKTDNQISECANGLINNINEYIGTTFQRVRFVNRYSSINACLMNRDDIVVDGEIIKINNDIEDIINAMFSDNYLSELCIFTTNKKAIPISIVDIVDDSFFNDLSFGDDALWTVEGTDSQAYLCMYEKYEFYTDCYNVLRIRIPIKQILKGFYTSSFERVYLSLKVGNQKPICVGIENGKFLSEKFENKIYKKDYEIPELNGTLSVYIDRNIIVRNVVKQCVIYFVAVLLLFCFAFAVSWVVSENITSELNDIVSSMNKNNIDRMKTSKIKSKEFKIIQKYLINLTDKIKEENNEKIELQTKMLSQRITPHFIYNNLSAIKSTCSDKFTRAAVDKFVKYCRNIFSNNTGFIKVKDEIKNSCEYLELLQFCYGFEFRIVTDIDEKCADMTLPVNILQPILENAFIHGINRMPDEFCGVIKIEAKTDLEYLYIRITDNAGMLNKSENENKHHALDVLRKLICMYYKNTECGITLNGNDTQTTAEVKLEVNYEIENSFS